MTRTNNKLAKAIALAISGVALTAAGMTSAHAGYTMYNTFTTTANSATDGWTRVYDNGTTSPGTATGPESQGNKGAYVPWVGARDANGNAVTDRPLGYNGSEHLNWAADLKGFTDSVTISTADAQTNHMFTAEIDTGGGAWNDGGRDANGLITETPTGWKHQTDIGLIRSEHNAVITIYPTTLGTLQNPTFSRFGITIFTGMDATTANYGHHGGWNCPTCTTPNPYTRSNPYYGTGVGQGLSYLTHSDNVDANNPLSFMVSAGQIYSIFLGGVGFANWNAGVDQYQLVITAVPEPTTLSLFGIALAGMVAGRRKAKLAA